MRTIFLAILTILVLNACAAIEGKKRSSTFETAVFRYSKAIRWSEFGFANSMRRLPEGEYASPSLEYLEQIRVASYETLETVHMDEGATVRVTVRIKYYHDDGMKLITLIDNQIWKYDEDMQTWYIATPLPDFR